MLNRRDFLKASAIVLSGLTGIICSESNTDASPSLDYNASKPLREESLQREIEEIRGEIKNARKRIIFSYEEWKAVKEFSGSPKDIAETIRKDIAKSNLRNKAILILRNPEQAYGFLTEKEREFYELELKMIEPIFDRRDINQKYNLNLTQEQFQSLGAKILWFLDKEYSYRYSDEQATKKKK